MEGTCTEYDPGGAVHRAQGSRLDTPRQGGSAAAPAAQVQAIRFNHPDQAKGRQLQRLVEALQRAQRKLPAFLA